MFPRMVWISRSLPALRVPSSREGELHRDFIVELNDHH